MISYMKCIYAHNKSWGKNAFEQLCKVDLKNDWGFVQDNAELESIFDKKIDIIFFVHWSHRVPEHIISQVECVCFHMTDLPFGRGGSPLQNLILRGHKETKLTAIRMTNRFDEGPIYAKWNLSLEGTAQEIYERTTYLANKGILELLSADRKPAPQEGDVVMFQRRTKEDSELPSDLSLDEIYDFIRMLDADGYPNAYIVRNGMKWELFEAKKSDQGLIARIRIQANEEC